MEQKLRNQKKMEQMEVKTISERSQEESDAGCFSMGSSLRNTPLNNHSKYLSSGGL
jgi:hypothetical protein